MKETVQRWHVGDQVWMRGGWSPYGSSVVIGHKPDGRCMTMLIEPPPWMTPEQRAQVYLVDPSELTAWEPAMLVGAGTATR